MAKQNIKKTSVTNEDIQTGMIICDGAIALLVPAVAIFLRSKTQYGIQDTSILYTCVSCITTLIMMRFTGVHKITWHAISYNDAIRILTGTSLGVALALLIQFPIDRLNSIARSVPVIHVGFQALLIIGLRAWAWKLIQKKVEAKNYSLIIGCNTVSSLYIEACERLDNSSEEIKAIIAQDPKFTGMKLKSKLIMGSIQKIDNILLELRSKGIHINKIVIAIRPKNMPSDTLNWIEFNKNRFHLVYLWQNDSSVFHVNIENNNQENYTEIKTENIYEKISQRGFDLVLSIILIFTLFPIYISLYGFVAINLGNPVLFKQRRAGQNGKAFEILKFRTMRTPNNDREFPEKSTQFNRSFGDENRSSKIGKIMRKTRLDEIPQLFNILTGKMSFIGSRPLLFQDHESENIAYPSKRPGLTGWAQIHGGQLLSASEKKYLDLWYESHKTPFRDAYILVQTILVFIKGDIRNEIEIQKSLNYNQSQPLKIKLVSETNLNHNAA